jgi:hypothetical protein
MRRLAFLVALAVVLAAVASACGIQADTTPRSLAADEVPYGLLDEGPPIPSPSTSVPEVDRVNVAVYFLLGERLQPAPRTLPDPPSAARVLNSLLSGPTDEEAVSGLRTAINPTTQATVTRPAPDIIAVDLTPDFTAVPGLEQRLAIAQIVFTATGVEGVSAVRFSIGGASIGIPLPDGTVTAEPVTRDAFPNLAPSEPNPNGPA